MICLLCGKSTNFNEQEDEQAEYDSIGTIESIGKALKKAGCETFFIEAGTELSEKLKKCNPDIVFNIAEGKGGRGREAQVPSMLNYYGIPFTGSDETTLCIALDKGLTKRIVKSCRINQCFFGKAKKLFCDFLDRKEHDLADRVIRGKNRLGFCEFAHYAVVGFHCVCGVD